MNKVYLRKILLILVSCLSLSCSQLSSIYQPISKPEEQKEIPTNNLSNVISIIPTWTHPHPVNDKWISFNTGFMFTAPIEKEPEVKKISQELSPNTLRFPGGTVANYYHPTGKGYGFKDEEVKGGFSDVTKAMPLFDKNAIEHFASLCKMSQSKVVYVANLLTGTIDETLWALEYFHKQNIPVVGVELGNEYYLQQYREYFPDVQSYIQKARLFASAIRKKYPKLPLGVVAANATEPQPKNNHGRFQNEWNRALGKETFYDFYIPHLYSKVDNCENTSKDIQSLFECATTILSPEYYQYLQVVIDHYKTFYGNKKMWITEWNMDGSSNVSNTLLHAAYTAEFLLGLVDASHRNPELELAFYHNYGSGGFTAPIFTYTNDHKYPHFKKVDKIAYNASYFPFYYYRKLINEKAQRSNEKISYPSGLSNQNVILKTFISPDKQTLYLFFINKSSTSIQYDVQGAKSIKSVEGIQGEFLWSVAGVNGIKNKYPQHIDLIQQISFDRKSEIFSIPRYSIGLITFSLI